MRGFGILISTAIVLALAVRDGHATFTTFESGQVRPLAMSPDGSRLFAVDTPDDQLEVFTIDATDGSLTHEASIPVGLEPVAVAARTNTEIWVVNHLSDSVSIVDLAATPPHVVHTLLVGDEPRDIVFAGTGGTRAFITTAHRGQNRPGDPQLTTPGVGRADVWVFDATSLGTTLGGTPRTIVTLFTDTPRALAASADVGTVYAAVFKSGNQTTATSSLIPCDGFDSSAGCTVSGVAIPGSPPGPATNHAGIPAPAVAMILKTDPAGVWRDIVGRDWTAP